MASKLDTFLTENKIPKNRLIAASRQIERLRPEDRTIRLKQSQARKSEDGKVPDGLGDRRSGRTLTAPGVARALLGQRVSGPMKTRILSAVNRILSQRKQDQVTFGTLFDMTPAKPKDKGESSEE